MNTFSLKRRISDDLSPMTIVGGVKLKYNKYFKAILSKCPQAFEGSDNTMKEKCIGAIALRLKKIYKQVCNFSVSRRD